jgi:hypothetical protein
MSSIVERPEYPQCDRHSLEQYFLVFSSRRQQAQLVPTA